MPTLPATPVYGTNYAQTMDAATLIQWDTLCTKLTQDHGIDYSIGNPLYPSDLTKLEPKLLRIAVDQYSAHRGAGLPRNVSLNYLASLQPSHADPLATESRPAHSTAEPLTTNAQPLVIQAIESYYRQFVISVTEPKSSILHQYIYFNALGQVVGNRMVALVSHEECLAQQAIDAVLNELDHMAKDQMDRLYDITVAWAQMVVADPTIDGAAKQQLLEAFIGANLGNSHVPSQPSVHRLARKLLQQFGENQGIPSADVSNLKEELHQVLWMAPCKDPLLPYQQDAMKWAQELASNNPGLSTVQPLGHWLVDL